MPILNTKKMLQAQYRSLYKQITEEKLEIPIIQRHYAWEKEQIDELFGEMVLFLEKSQENNLYDSEINLAIGQGIFYRNNGGITYIYDGQQRILTYLLFLRSMANRYLSLIAKTDDVKIIDSYKKKIEVLNKACIIEANPERKEPRVLVQKKDREAFEDILGIEPVKKRNNSLIPHAYKIIDKYVNDSIDDINLDNFYHVLTNKIEMLILRANDDVEAEGLFYTTNSTGKALSVSELLHARIHQVFNKTNSKLVSKWDEIYQKLGKKAKSISIIDSLLLYSVQVDRFVITSAKVFNDINATLIKPNGKEYLEKLISRLDTLYNLLYENNPNFTAVNAIISMTAIKQIYPLFLALSEKYDKDSDISKKTIDILTYIILQNNVVRQSPGTTKHALADILVNIKNGKPDIFDEIPRVTNVDVKLTDLSIEYDNKTGKALLALMLMYYNQSNTSIIISSKDSELEHIVPQDPARWMQESQLWADEIQANSTRLIYSLGNFVIVSAKVNKTLSNNVWSIKHDAVQKNTLVISLSGIINDNLLITDEVTPQYIINRGKKISDLMITGIFKDFIQ